MFVGLKCVGYLVYCFVVSGYEKVFHVWVGASGEWVWPHVNFVVWAKCVVGVGLC